MSASLYNVTAGVARGALAQSPTVEIGPSSDVSRSPNFQIDNATKPRLAITRTPCHETGRAVSLHGAEVFVITPLVTVEAVSRCICCMKAFACAADS
eukprot:1622757-Pleurochrysis_carterae.AAC.1